VKPKQQRLVLVIAALGETATYFYSPSDAQAKGVPAGQAIRLGGLVEPGSVVKNGATTAFRVTDNARSTPVSYTGLIPDLFREGQGVIAEGRFDASGTFVAETVLAKHDENYMPPEVAGALHKTASAEQP
jgi:cytochrome c-type biogenesis protein CcmE